MKRIVSVMIGLALALGATGLGYAQEKGTDQRASKKDPKGKKAQKKKQTKSAPK